jgi:hypothetical protein
MKARGKMEIVSDECKEAIGYATYLIPQPNKAVNGFGLCAASASKNRSGLNTSGSPHMLGLLSIILDPVFQ